MYRSILHVVPYGVMWGVKWGGVRSLLHTSYYKQDAIHYAVSLAKQNAPSQVLIHRRDGTIEDERTFIGDPFPPRG